MVLLDSVCSAKFTCQQQQGLPSLLRWCMLRSKCRERLRTCTICRRYWTIWQ